MRIITLSQGRPEKALHGRCPTHILVPATWLTSGKSPGRICRGRQLCAGCGALPDQATDL
jgi:hypothetical protein